MFDFLIDLVESVFDCAGDTVSEIDWSSVIDGVISTAPLVLATIVVASITEESIRNELKNRSELKKKNVTSAVVKDFVQQAGYTEITLAALNAQNQQVGSFKMKAKSSHNIAKGDKIWI